MVTSSDFCLTIINFITHVNRFQRYTVRVLSFEIVREVSIQNIAKYTLRLLAVVRVEGEALNHQSILKEVNVDVGMLFETFHIALDGRDE